MRVSVCIASYNGEKYIQKQIESIISQLSYDDEVIISDDGSTDGTIGIIKGFKDSRIKLVFNQSKKRRKSVQDRFRQVTKNFENALTSAAGNYIFLSDQDDIWDKNKIETTLHYLRAFDLVVSNYGFIDENDNQINLNLIEGKRSTNFVSNLLVTPYIGCGMAFSRKVLNNSLPFPKKLFAHDLWIGFIAQHIGKVAFIDEKLFNHRRHGKNASYSFEKSRNSFFFKINYRVNFLFMILIRYVQIFLKK